MLALAHLEKGEGGGKMAQSAGYFCMFRGAFRVQDATLPWGVALARSRYSAACSLSAPLRSTRLCQ